ISNSSYETWRPNSRVSICGSSVSLLLVVLACATKETPCNGRPFRSNFIQNPDRVEGAVLMGVGMRIAFAGPRATGKTTLAEYLVKHHGFACMSLAAPIKRIIAECPTDSHERHQYLLRWAAELFPGRIVLQARFATEAARMMATERDPGRRAQLLGTEVGRALDPEVWIRYLLEHLPEEPVVVDDVRFRNE